MYVVKFCRAPSQLWVGVIEYNGGHVFATGNTMDNLMHRMKQAMITRYHVSARQIILDTKQHETYEFEKLFKVFMSPIFVGKYWKKKGEPEYKEPAPMQEKVPMGEPDKAMRISRKDEFITEMDGDTLVVYVLREVARYKLHGEKKEPAMTAVPVETYKPEPVLNIPFSNPARTSVIQERYAGPQDVPFRHQVDTSITGVVLANAEPESPVLQPDSESQEENLGKLTQD